jgi:hypothetical protein
MGFGRTAMTPQERKLIDDLFDRLATLENNPRDADATRAITDGLGRAPNATYALVQSVLVQDEALKRADARIRELETAAGVVPNEPAPSGGFLDTMRDAVFGKREPHGSVPTVRPGGVAATAAPAAPAASPSGVSGGISGARVAPPPAAAPAPPSSVWNNAPQPQPQPGGPWLGAQPAATGTPAGGSFLGTAAAAAAGTIGGALLMNSFRNMFGGHHPSTFYDQPNPGQPAPGGTTPWTPSASDSTLARDAGLDDINRSPRTAYDDTTQRASLLDPHDTKLDTNDATNFDDNADFDASDTGGLDGGGDN